MMELPDEKKERLAELDAQGNPVPSDTGMNPLVAEYLKKNFFTDTIGNADAKIKATNDFEETNPKMGVGGELLTGLRAALRNDASYDDLKKSFTEQRARERADTLAPFDEREKAYDSKFKAAKGSLEAGKTIGDIGYEGGQRARTVATQQEEDSPDSAVSKSYQELAKKMGHPSPDGLSATKLKTQLPALEKIYAINQKHLDRQEAANDRGSAKKTAMDEKQKQLDEATFKDYVQTALTVKRGASAGNYGMANKREILSDNALRLIAMAERGDVKKSRQFETDLAATLASVTMGGNQPAEQTIRAFMSKTGKKDMAGIAEYISGNPQDALTQEFLENYRHAMEAEKDFWKQKKNGITGGMEIALEPVFERNPGYKDRWHRIQEAKDRETEMPPAPGSSGKITGQDLDKMSTEELRKYVNG